SFLVTSGILPALGRTGAGLAQTVVDEAAKPGVPLCFDLNYRARLWSVEEAAPALRPFIAASQILVASSRDVELLYDLVGTDERRVVTLRERIAPHAELVVMTLGQHGAIASTPDGRVV